MVKEIIIPKEKAVFWLDTNGCWHNVHGKFQHKKIIDYFHASIQKDQNGYYLTQSNGQIMEKVYFRYEDTALFVFDVEITNDNVLLNLNTQKQINLNPTKLFTHKDSLYMQLGDDRIKFVERALMKISKMMTSSDDQFFITIHHRKYKIDEA